MKARNRSESMSKLFSWFMLATLVLSAVVIPVGSAAAAVLQQWAARYNGPGNRSDRAEAIAVDGRGNIYVTGESADTGAKTDYATIKYDPNGNRLWVARYNGPGNARDQPAAIVVDGGGNVYVTGYSTGSGTSYDYATIKYDPNGNQLWVARYTGPGKSSDYANAIAIDGSGNVYVTGTSASGSTSDYATVKYDPNGNQLWVARYNGPANSDDSAVAIAVDASGNVSVTGTSASGSTSDYATVKYDPNGNELWVARYNGPGNTIDSAVALALDGSGNAYVTGYSTGSDTNNDYATIKYDPNGNELWVARYNGPDNTIDSAVALALDGSGNVYVTGTSASGSASDYVTVKYDQTGKELWVAHYNGPGDSFDQAVAMALDASGNVYVTGSSGGTGPASDYATVKYDQTGKELWVARYNGPGHAGDVARAIALDGSGNVYVTGGTNGPGNSSYNYATVKYRQVDNVAINVLPAGNLHSCAVIAGSVQCWGDNSYGQLGNGHTWDSATPVGVRGITTATTMAAGRYHNCARLTDGSVQCWGRNTSGELGNGAIALFSSTRVSVSGITTATAVAAGGAHSCALLAGGSVQCWGDNSFGQLGDGSTTNSLIPVTVSGISSAIAIAIDTGNWHSCALLAGGSVQCWGYNVSGRLGNGSTADYSASPVTVSGISTATALAVGYLHSCALLAGGSVQCWGENRYGRLGNGSTKDSAIPVTVSGVTTATDIVAGGSHSCARLIDGQVQCWGLNSDGQLGNGSTSTRNSSIPVTVTGVTTAIALSAGNSHSCAALADGSEKCWGRNNVGQLGDGTLISSATPVTVKSGILASTTTPVVTSTVQGAAQMGPFLSGSTVTLRRLDSRGQPTGEPVTRQTVGILGQFDVTVSWDGPTLIEIRGNYFDENTGTNSTKPLALEAVVNLVPNTTIASNVNLFTHLMSARLRTLMAQGSSFAEAQNTARTELQTRFGLQLASTTVPEQLDLTQGTGPLARDNALLLVVSGGLMVKNETERQNSLDQLTSDFARNGSGVDLTIISGALPNLDETLAANLSKILGIADPPNSADLLSASIPSWIPDQDGDGTSDPLDADRDGDSVPNVADAFPLNPLESVDTDKDGIGNNADPDDDNDGVLDELDINPLDPKVGANPLPGIAELPISPDFPPVLTMMDGTPVTTAADWYNKRAHELRRLFQHYMYGYMPPKAPTRFRLLNNPAVNNDAFGGKAIYKEVAIDVQLPNGNPAGTIYLSLYLPKGAVKPAPIFLGLNKCPNHTVTNYPGVTIRGLADYGWLPEECYMAAVASGCNAQDERGCLASEWEVENTIDRGYAFASLSTEDMRPDAAAFSGHIHAAFAPFAPGDNQTKWGALAAWAWGVERAVDYLETDPDIDKNRIAVVGHSRRGKAVLLAGAMDTRIGMVIAHQSGTAGTAPSRGALRSVKETTTDFPHWYDGLFPAFGGVDGSGNPNEYRLPLDQHSLVALVAPRPLLDGAGLNDPNYVPDAVLGRLQAASAVYELLGVPGLAGVGYVNGETDKIPADYAGRLLQYRRNTDHVMNLGYWNAFIDYADVQFGRAP